MGRGAARCIARSSGAVHGPIVDPANPSNRFEIQINCARLSQNENPLHIERRSAMRVFLAVLMGAAVFGCSVPSESKPDSAAATQSAAVSQEKGGQEEFGPYELVA